MSVMRSIMLQKIKARLETFVGENSCTISKPALTRGPTGAPGSGHVIVASDVPCRIIDGSSETEEIGDQQAILEKYKLIVPVGTELGVKYRVTVDDGNTYKILDIISRYSESVDAQAMITRER